MSSDSEEEIKEYEKSPENPQDSEEVVNLVIKNSVKLTFEEDTKNLSQILSSTNSEDNLTGKIYTNFYDIKDNNNTINDMKLDTSKDSSEPYQVKNEQEGNQKSKDYFTNHFTREAQNVSRNKDLYLQLVNTAIYENFNYKYYENPTNYNKAAEYFALYGFGDSLDSTFQFDKNKEKNLNIITKSNCGEHKHNVINKIKSFNVSTIPAVDQQNCNESKRNLQNGMFPLQSTMQHCAPIMYPQSMLTSQQQILFHLNQPANMLSNYPGNTLVPYGTNPMWLTNSMPYFNATTAAAAAYFNETHINTSIIQQQQQYNIFGSSGPYDIQYLSIYYAHLLQRSQQISQTVSANSNRLFDQQQRTSSNLIPYDSSNVKSSNPNLQF